MTDQDKNLTELQQMLDHIRQHNAELQTALDEARQANIALEEDRRRYRKFLDYLTDSASSTQVQPDGAYQTHPADRDSETGHIRQLLDGRTLPVATVGCHGS